MDYKNSFATHRGHCFWTSISQYKARSVNMLAWQGKLHCWPLTQSKDRLSSVGVCTAKSYLFIISAVHLQRIETCHFT